jgi:hypothetical protein
MKAICGVAVVSTIALLLGCSKSEPTKKRDDGATSKTASPDGITSDGPTNAASGADVALRRFLVAMVSGDQVEIRATIIDNPDAEILWQGNAKSSDEKAEATRLVNSTTFQHLKVGDEVHIPGGKTLRLDEDYVNENRQQIAVPDIPIPFILAKVNGIWKVDAGTVIAGRKAAAAAAARAK